MLERLAEIGVETASVRFRNAQYDGTNDVTVDAPKWVSDNCIAVSASGTTITFIEFGTGVYYSEEHPQSSEFGFQRGGYGQGKGSQNSWGYYGEQGTNGQFVKTTDKGDVYVTHGNPPARAMYDASKDIRNNIITIAKEVFRND